VVVGTTQRGSITAVFIAGSPTSKRRSSETYFMKHTEQSSNLERSDLRFEASKRVFVKRDIVILYD